MIDSCNLTSFSIKVRAGLYFWILYWICRCVSIHTRLCIFDRTVRMPHANPEVPEAACLMVRHIFSRAGVHHDSLMQEHRDTVIQNLERFHIRPLKLPAANSLSSLFRVFGRQVCSRRAFLESECRSQLSTFEESFVLDANRSK